MLSRDVEINHILSRLRIKMDNLKYDIKENTEVNSEDIDMEKIIRLVNEYNDTKLIFNGYVTELNEFIPF